MPNYVDFSQSGGKAATATLDFCTLSAGSAVEVHFRVPAGSTAAQSIFTVFQKSLGDLGIFTLAVEGTAVSATYASITVMHGEAQASQSWTPPGIAVNDGNWHQLAIALSNNTIVIYVDGTTAMVPGSSPPTPAAPLPFAFAGAVAGNIMLGGFDVSYKTYSYSGTFNGQITEVRMYGNPQNFVPTPGAPVGLNTYGLGNYWPFWTNFPGGPNQNVIHPGTPATLSNCQIVYDSNELIYDPWTEAILNVAYAPLNPFSDTLHAQAAQDICNQMATPTPKGQVPDLPAQLQPPNVNLAGLRSLYANDGQINNGIFMPKLELTTPNPQNLQTPGYANAFSDVQTALITEASTAISVWTYNGQAQAFLGAYQLIVTGALATVGKSITLVDSSNNTSLLSDAQEAVTDLDAAAEIAEELAEFLAVAAVAARRKTKTSLKDEEEGGTGTAALQLMYGIFKFALSQAGSGGEATFTATANTTGAFNNISTQINNYYVKLLGNLGTNTSAVLTDGAKLALLAQHSNAFYFPYAAPAGDFYDAIQSAYQLSFTQTILTKMFGYWEFPGVMDNTFNAVGVYNMDILNSDYFYQFVQNGNGTYNFYAISNFDSAPDSCAFTGAIDQSSVDFIQNTLNVSSSQLFGWPFTACVFDPGPGPGAKKRSALAQA